MGTLSERMQHHPTEHPHNRSMATLQTHRPTQCPHHRSTATLQMRCCINSQQPQSSMQRAAASSMQENVLHLLWSILEKSRISPRMVSSVSPLSRMVSASSLACARRCRPSASVTRYISCALQQQSGLSQTCSTSCHYTPHCVHRAPTTTCCHTRQLECGKGGGRSAAEARGGQRGAGRAAAPA